MKISVIICTYSFNRLAHVINAIESLLAQLEDNEIIISVDNNEALLKVLKKIYGNKISYVLNKNNGLSNARNAGLEIAKGDIIAFLDDDAEADPNWINSLLSCYKQNVIAVGGKVIPKWENKRPTWFPHELDWIVGCTYKGHEENFGEVRNLIGCNMSFKKDVFADKNYFNHRIGRTGNNSISGEEMEFCYRIKNIYSKKIIFNPESIVYHNVTKNRESLKHIIKRSFGEGVSKAIISKDIGIKLNNENGYLKLLLYNSIPKYMKNAIKLKNPFNNISKVISILFSLLSVFIGFSYKTIGIKMNQTKTFLNPDPIYRKKQEN